MSVIGRRQAEIIVEDEPGLSPEAFDRINSYTKIMNGNLNAAGYTSKPDPDRQPYYIKTQEPIVEAASTQPELEPSPARALSDIFPEPEELPEPYSQSETATASQEMEELSSPAAEITGLEVKVNKFDADKILHQGLSKVIKAFRHCREISAAPFKLVENASRFAYMRVLSSQPSFESEEVGVTQTEAADEENNPESRAWYKKKKVIGSLGLLAVGTLVGYAAYKGIMVSGPSRAQEAANQLGNPKNPAHYPDILGNITPPTKAHQIITDHAGSLKDLANQPPIHSQAVLHGVNHAQATAEQISASTHFVTIKPGDGYTQALQNFFPNHDANTYLEGYKQAVKQFGPGFLKGAHHYRMANGDWGLSGGDKVELTKPAAHMLSNFFSSRP